MLAAVEAGGSAGVCPTPPDTAAAKMSNKGLFWGTKLLGVLLVVAVVAFVVSSAASAPDLATDVLFDGAFDDLVASSVVAVSLPSWVMVATASLDDLVLAAGADG